MNALNQYTEISSAEPNQQTATPSSQLSAFQLSYNNDGNVTLIQTSTGTWNVEYNAENRPVRWTNAATGTVITMSFDSQGRRTEYKSVTNGAQNMWLCFLYDSQGRRFEKKVTAAGTTTLHHRYIYRGYLQVAALDLTRSVHPVLWFVTWDPSQPTTTRPLAIQKDGTWFTYGYDLTKNICEVFGPAGYIRTAYAYAPFGAVTASDNGVTQPFQWSSEHYDSELDLVYYNYRHYSPSLGRFLSRDPIEEQGGLNLYAFVGNRQGAIDLLGESFSGWVYCLAKCIENNDLIDGFYEALSVKVSLMIAGGGVPKRFAVWFATQTGNQRMAIAIGRMDPKIPLSMLAWKPMKASLSKIRNGRIWAANISMVSTPLMLVYRNVMAVIETECAIYCCRNKRYNKKDGLLIFNVSRAVDFYVKLLSWKDLGYEETDMLP